MNIRELKTEEIVSALVKLDTERAEAVKSINKYKAELMSRGLAYMQDTNTRSVKYKAENGNCTIIDAMKLSVINDKKLRELLPEGIYDKFTQRTVKVDYKYDTKLEKALKAVFNKEYILDTSLETFLRQIPMSPDEKQMKVLLKKLKGEYEKDKEILCAVFNTEDGEQFEAELFYIYEIKNAELIRRFLPADVTEEYLQQLRECMIVESSTKIEIEENKLEEK